MTGRADSSDETGPGRRPDDGDPGALTTGGPTAVPPTDPRPPAALELAARRLFGDRLDVAVRYAELLMTDGVVRGLIGPREAPRIWDRHLLNCAAVAELIAEGARVVDVGSGAGLPGIVLAVARPDLSITLVEPLARRAAFLTEMVAALELTRTTVVRARAEECVPVRRPRLVEPAEVVTARAVAPLDRLTAWCIPLAAKGGRVLALKGDSAAAEIESHANAIHRLGGGPPRIRQCGVGIIEPPTTVVEIVRERMVDEAGTARPSGRRR